MKGHIMYGQTDRLNNGRRARKAAPASNRRRIRKVEPGDLSIRQGKAQTPGELQARFLMEYARTGNLEALHKATYWAKVAKAA